MQKIEISAHALQMEAERLKERQLRADRLFVLLLGPSATGKSTVIQELNHLTDAFSYDYIKPYMTRQNREGETDKVSISPGEFDAMEANAEFVVVNHLYDVSYGTPLAGIQDSLLAGNVPILDYPLHAVDALRRPEYDLFCAYVYPPGIEEWRQRMEKTGRNQNGRLEAGLAELGSLAVNDYVHPVIDLSVINSTGQQAAVASTIHETIVSLRASAQ